MTSRPAGSDDDARGPAICKRPGCGRPLPAQGRGRNRVFCGGDCAQRFHNDARIPAPAAGAVTGDQDPLTALDALTRQAAVLVRAARHQADAARAAAAALEQLRADTAAQVTAIQARAADQAAAARTGAETSARERDDALAAAP